MASLGEGSSASSGLPLPNTAAQFSDSPREYGLLCTPPRLSREARHNGGGRWWWRGIPRHREIRSQGRALPVGARRRLPVPEVLDGRLGAAHQVAVPGPQRHHRHARADPDRLQQLDRLDPRPADLLAPRRTARHPTHSLGALHKTAPDMRRAATHLASTVKVWAVSRTAKSEVKRSVRQK